MTIRSLRGEPLRHKPAVRTAVQPASSKEHLRRAVMGLQRGRRACGGNTASATVRKSQFLVAIDTCSNNGRSCAFDGVTRLHDPLLALGRPRFICSDANGLAPSVA